MFRRWNKNPVSKSRFIEKRVPKICVNNRVAASWTNGLVCESQNRPVLGAELSNPPTSQQLTVQQLPNHPSSEIRHVSLSRKDSVKKRGSFLTTITKQHRCNEIMGLNYLCKFDWLFFGDVFCIFARKHSTVAAIHLLWDFLRWNKKGKCRSYKMTEYKKCQC